VVRGHDRRSGGGHVPVAGPVPLPLLRVPGPVPRPGHRAAAGQADPGAPRNRTGDRPRHPPRSHGTHRCGSRPCRGVRGRHGSGREHAAPRRHPGRDRGGRPAHPAGRVRRHRRGLPGAARQPVQPGCAGLRGRAGRARHRPGPVRRAETRHRGGPCPGRGRAVAAGVHARPVRLAIPVQLPQDRLVTRAARVPRQPFHPGTPRPPGRRTPPARSPPARPR
jgi:hypothetical protein